MGLVVDMKLNFKLKRSIARPRLEPNTRGLLALSTTVLFHGALGCKAYDPRSNNAGASTQTQTQTQTSPSSSSPLTFAPSTSSSSSAATTNPAPTTTQEKQDEQVDPGGCTPGERLQCSTDATGKLVLFPGSFPQGNCKYGEKTCLPTGLWGPCVGLIAPQARDNCSLVGDDANCNGAPNDGCTCVGSQATTRPCGTNTGACQAGVQRCQNGIWGECEGEVKAKKELCDGRGIDEDCDGRADLADPDCTCLDTKAPELCQVSGKLGDCALGVRRCKSGRMTPCQPRFTKLQENCISQPPDQFGAASGDEDCDGQVNELDESGPLNCKVYMLDKDNDRWGAIGPSYREDPVKATHGCFCALPAHLRHFVPAQGQENRDCGDCEHEGHFVYPGMIAFQESPSSCLSEVRWGGGVFDYNCDGQEEQRYVGVDTRDCDYSEETKDTEDKECVLVGEKQGHWFSEEFVECGKSEAIPDCRDTFVPSVGRYCRSTDTTVDQDTQECR